VSAVRRLAVCDAARQLQQPDFDDTRYRLGAILGLYAYRLNTGQYRAALGVAEQFHAVAAETADRSDVPIGSRLIGLALHILGNQPGARRHLEPLVGSRFATAPSSHIILYQYDQRVLLDCYYARVLWLQGLGDQARRHTESLVEYARTKDHLLSLLYSLLIAACPIALYVGDLTTADHHVRLAFDLAARHALEVWTVWAQCFEAILLNKRGENGAGSQLLQSSLERLPEPAFHHHMSLLLAELAAGLGGAGQIAEGWLWSTRRSCVRSRRKRDGTSRSCSARRASCFSWDEYRPPSKLPRNASIRHSTSRDARARSPGSCGPLRAWLGCGADSSE